MMLGKFHRDIQFLQRVEYALEFFIRTALDDIEFKVVKDQCVNLTRANV